MQLRLNPKGEKQCKDTKSTPEAELPFVIEETRNEDKT